MFTIEKSIFIDRPQQEVFDYTSDPANHQKWQSQALSAEWSSEGPHGVGSNQRSVMRFLGRDIETNLQITVWDPPNQFSFKSVSGPIPHEGNFECKMIGICTQYFKRASNLQEGQNRCRAS